VVDGGFSDRERLLCMDCFARLKVEILDGGFGGKTSTLSVSQVNVPDVHRLSSNEN